MGGNDQSSQSPLEKYTTDLTQLAADGKLDPVIGRDAEVRRTLQVLARRTKSNPVLLGPAGVGKTAIMEGLAQRIANREVPESLLDKSVKSLDLAGLLAGAGVRGMFEERIKALLQEIEKQEGKIILFIDEIHMLFGLGKAEGALDAANMMKPLLARGVLRLCGATTFEEYRNTIEKDAALARRFQPVMVKEPSLSATISILRGLRGRYEAFHGIGISDSALVTAAQYAERYLSERKNPDAAIDLLDEAASALRLQQESKPEAIESLERNVITMQIELESLRHETDIASKSRRDTLEIELRDKKEEMERLTAVWNEEKRKLDDVRDIKEKLEDAQVELERMTREGNLQRVAELQYAVIPELKKRLPQEDEDGSSQEGQQGQDDKDQGSFLHDRVTSEDIAAVVARTTGIPVSNLLRGDRERLLHIEDSLRQRIVGQDEALTTMAEAIRLSRAGLQSQTKPLASFLMLGQTGTGKTETCKAVADFLFDSKDALIMLDCSELSEQHSISKLVGAPPGYIGYDQAGGLTERVRRKPYSIILFDEIEKAARSVQMVLLQILDEGKLTDAQGRQVDFRQTIVVCTSNLGAEVLSESGATTPDGKLTCRAKESVSSAVQHALPPELLNRFDEILHYNRLSRDSLRGIVDIRLKEIQARLTDRRIELAVDDGAKQWLATNGYSDIYGARPLNRLIQKALLTPLAKVLIEGSVRDGDTVFMGLKKDAKPDEEAIVISGIRHEQTTAAANADTTCASAVAEDIGPDVIEGEILPLRK
ncbi:P-loop containing nucleoside triphosphate hydrolase protein [Tilletiaria anomala UBC 951]|uniref:p-loop containing nucleoside triphosphate hydrolase protein n=1 Tax=Tilletiaria anomala (strain ATCC 24038 / CBS 436.72 / UBC 951) TaxID=1037660 RepID=A0A066WDQ1_TILAU|nr:P-loop containing nucleoside triphosphate hydrolase protein [Tilletiaria anomala UBC 951]KDN52082.1 P-loop containing nucleoside triphosphate hydrolase protein [Tilletiaria anomala UBC 951]